MGCLTLAFQRKKAEVQLELWKLCRCKKEGGGMGVEIFIIKKLKHEK